MERKYVYISSDNSKDFYPKNNAYDFTVKLNDPLELQGKWKVALSAFYFGDEPLELYVYCTLCESNNVLDRYLPILRRIYQSSSEFQNLQFVSVNRNFVDTIKFYIRDLNHEIPSKTISRVSCALNFSMIKNG